MGGQARPTGRAPSRRAVVTFDHLIIIVYRGSVDGIDDDALPVKRKYYAVAALLGAFGLAIGFVHIYGGQARVGRVLIGVALVGVLGVVLGNPLRWLLPAVWVFDVVIGTVHLVRFNRARAQALERPSTRFVPRDPPLLN